MFFRRKRADGSASEAPGQTGAAPQAGQAGSPGAPATWTSPAEATTQFLTGDQHGDRQRVQILLEAISRVANARVDSAEDLERLLVQIVDLSIEVTDAERGLLLLERAGGEIEVHVARGREARPVTGEVRFSTTIAKRVLDQREPLRATVQSDSEALELAQSVFDLKLRTVMCVPLSTLEEGASGGRPQGALYVDSRAATRQYKQADLSLFMALATQISASMQKARLHLDSLEKLRLEQTLELASSIQRDLMPRAPYALEGFEVHGWYRPAEQAAGDFYDIVKVKGGSLAFAIGDVTGHGIGPALITASAQASLRSFLKLIDDPGQAVSLLNQDLSERMDDGRFLTLFLGVLSPDGQLTYVNGGHPPAMLYRAADRSCTPLEGHGPALGMLEDEIYETSPSLQLEPGDAILAFTDGALEARTTCEKQELLGEEGVQAAFCEAMAAGSTASEVALTLAEHTLEYASGILEDDLTFIVVRRLPLGR
jgi:sigma-B regulation protein RsbU (phosphoserine phosphatase)